MPDAVLAILMALVNMGGTGSRHEVGVVSGYEGSLDYIPARLFERGWIVGRYMRKWQITERGKIAVAIEMGRRSRARALGYRASTPPVSDYQNKKFRKDLQIQASRIGNL